MTRPERISEIELLLQQLRQEEQIAAWMKKNWGTQITTRNTGLDEPRPWRCDVGGAHEEPVARGRGATEQDARAHAFTIIFTNEAAISGA